MSTSFIFFELEDTSFTNKVVGLKPQVLSFPGGLGNFYHLHAPGYGLDVEDFRKYHKKSKVKTAQKSTIWKNNVFVFLSLFSG